MKLFLSICLATLWVNISIAQDSVLGTWKAVDDLDGQPTSHIKIYEEDGNVKGKIIKLYDQPEDVLCDLCPGDKKDQPILGMEILWDMKNEGSECTGGRIMDPKNGKTYKCRLWLDDDGTLKVRGYIGVPALGRTQTWYGL